MGAMEMRQGADMRKAILLQVVVVMAVSSVAYAEVRKLYYPNGQLKLEANFKDDKLEGIKRYYESGKLKEEANYKDDKLEGIGREYYPSGQLKEDAYYKNGVMISQKRYDSDGNLESDQGSPTE
jgi:antitoxin component YwqK of YwqJK toxin-antitoxin module